MISVNMIICNNQSQTKSHSSYEIMHCTPSLRNTITVLLYIKDMGNVNICHAACVVPCRVKENTMTVWVVGLKCLVRK